MMSKQIVSVVACAIIFVAVLSSCYGATMAPICKPGIVEELPPQIKKVCLALENSDELASALESYINNEAKSDDFVKTYGKRTDVDHIFLRFGKRR